MKEWKCPECKRNRSTEDNIIITSCPGCMGKMEVVEYGR